MKTKKCPRCGETMIEEVDESETQASGSAQLLTFACSDEVGRGSIDIYLAPNIRFKVTVYVCSNPECGCLSTDC